MKIFLMICAKSVMSYLLVFPCCFLINMAGELTLGRLHTVACLLPMLMVDVFVAAKCLRSFAAWRLGKSRCSRMLMSMVMFFSFVVDLLFLSILGWIVMAMLDFGEDGNTCWVDCRAFEDCPEFDSVVIPDGTMQSVSDGKPCVSSIDGVLYQRNAKELVAVPRDWQGDTLVVAEGTESIGSQALAFCRNLERVVFPEGLLVIGHRAFYGCGKLKEIVLPASVKVIGDHAFLQCSGLRSFTVPRDCLVLPDAFAGCTSLESFRVDPANEIYRELDGSIYDASGTVLIQTPIRFLNSAFRIPQGVVCIPSRAFEETVGLEEIFIPKGVDRIHTNFRLSADLRMIHVDSDNENYCDRDGILYDKRMTTLLRCPAAYTNSVVCVPSGVVDVAPVAFSGCHNVKRVILPDTLRRIGRCSFAHSGLVSFTVPAHLQEIALHSFADCTNLQAVTVPSGDVVIFEGAFSNCSNLSNFRLGDESGAYERVSHSLCLRENGRLGLFRVSARDIVDGALTVHKKIGTILADACSGISCLSSVRLHAGLTRIGQSAFVGCERLRQDWKVRLRTASLAIARSMLWKFTVSRMKAGRVEGLASYLPALSRCPKHPAPADS